MPGVQIDIAQAPDDARRALAYYERIYAASWKNPEPHPRFVPSLVEYLAGRGWLRMGCVSLENEPVAAQIWAVKDGIASIFKLAYDERFAQVSAGSVLTAQLMRHVLDVDRVHTVDYLTGDDAYKRDWMSHRRERVGVRAHRRGNWRGQLALLADRARAAFRPLLRRK
jgi:CelD/BcsL family acetyltransferase involved in cellulose biosynthesis